MPAIPRTLTAHPVEEHAAELAAALLAEGILRDSDYTDTDAMDPKWRGSIVAAIAAGITRWAQGILGGQELQRVEIGLHWTDDVARCSGMNTSLWVDAAPGRKALEPVGLLALMTVPREGHYPSERDCVVGPTVLELNAARPNLGWNILALLCDVLPPLCGVATPHYGYAEAGKYEAIWKYQPDLAPRMHCPILTQEQYLREVPLEACVGKLRPEVIRRAKTAHLSPRLNEIVARAIDLLGRFEALRSDMRLCDSHVLTAPTREVECAFLPGHAAKLPLCALRWSTRDALPQILDAYYRQVGDRGTNLAWCQGWQASNPASIHRAARNWRAVTTCVLRALALAEFMHCEVSE